VTRILTVDDEPIIQMIVEETLTSSGYLVDQADDGESAWSMLQAQTYELIVLDRMMPGLDGLALLRRIKADPRWHALPVIMITAAGTPKDIRDGMMAGAYYYLTKPFDAGLLRLMVGIVVAESVTRRRLKETGVQCRDIALTLFDHGEARFRTLDDAHRLAAALSVLSDGDDTHADTGLLELLVNAVEHGNLGLTYEDKARLRLAGEWEAEVERRLTLAPWSSRFARLAFRRDADTVVFTVTDQGNGFDWRPYMEFAAERAFDLNGRGIAKANVISFSALEYLGNGNTVVATAPAYRRVV
jgi:CheY-like chemotaxis protein